MTVAEPRGPLFLAAVVPLKPCGGGAAWAALLPLLALVGLFLPGKDLIQAPGVDPGPG